MKKISKWFSRFLVGIVAMAQIVSTNPAQIAYAAQETNQNANISNGIRYVALGDSITEPSDSYVSMVSKNLEKKYGKCTTDNLGVYGWTSGDLLDALTNPLNSKYKKIRNAVSQADIITLDIGSNDALITIANIVAESYGYSIENVEQIIKVNEMWAKKFEQGGFAAYMAYLSALRVGIKIHQRLYYGQEMPSALNKFEKNYISILKTLSALAPNAEVYIGNMYNPYVNAAPLGLGGFTVVDVDNYIGDYARKANKIISDNSDGRVIVDIYNTINDPCYIRGDVANYNYDPHPNQAGQNAIANKFIAAINNNTRK